MKTKLIIIGIFLSGGSVLTNINAQAPVDEKPSVKLGGYLRTESFYDTYINTETRDGELYYYPKRKSLDKDGNNKNELGQFEMLGLQSRLKASVTGGNAFGAKLSGMFETDFLGSTGDYKFNLRLRHAIIKMDWDKNQILVGQYWHPTIVPELAPNTVLFGSGVVFHPLNRPTQLRLTHIFTSNFKLIGTISTFSLHRPIEPSGTNTQRNSGIPEFNVQFQAGNVQSFFAAITAGYKFLKPYTTTPVNATDSIFAATKIIGSYHFSGSVGYSLPVIAIKAQCIYGENLTALNMIGGYAPIKGSRNSKGEYDYTNMKTIALWMDLETKGSKVRVGLFAGYTKNIGSSDSVEFVYKKYSDKIIIDSKTDLCRDPDLQAVYRIAPRVYFINGPIDMGVEYILTGANYGTYSGKKIINVKDKSVNNRFLISVRYTF